MKTTEIFEKVTEKIISNLQTAGSWQALWAMPKPVSIQGYFYNGINFFNLACSAYNTPVWGTFHQIRQNGGHVRKGEFGTIIVFWKRLKKQDPQTLHEKSFFMLKYYHVFNAEQCDFDEIGANKVLELSQMVAKTRSSNTRTAEEIVTGMSDAPIIVHPAIVENPCYNIAFDQIIMPKKEWFTSADEYYSTLFHEMTHATGHPKRLNRFTDGKSHRNNEEAYSKEELVAELGASYLAEIAGLQLNVENAASYIREWSNHLKNNTGWIIWAASRAEKAANYILGQTEDEEETEDIETQVVMAE